MLEHRAHLSRFVRLLLCAGTVALACARVDAAPERSAADAPVAASEMPGQTTADAVGRLPDDNGAATASAAPVAPVSASNSENAFMDRVRVKAATMAATAMNFIGVPYRKGGSSAERGFDCSGFTRQVFETSLGLVLPRRADEQARSSGLVAVKRDDLQPGDLVFFNTLRRTFSHVGIYLGDGKFIHSPKPGGEVRVEDMRFSYWTKRFTGARRAEPALEQVGSDSPSSPTAVLTTLSSPVTAIR